MSNWKCFIFGHDWERSGPRHEQTCKRCDAYYYDFDSCPECGHENSAVVWVAGVDCINCGASLA